MSSISTEPLQTVGTVQLTPDAGVLRAIGLNHGFASAIADLVDNSIDAHARHILIRFVTGNGLATGLLVVDDGTAWTPTACTQRCAWVAPRQTPDISWATSGWVCGCRDR